MTTVGTSARLLGLATLERYVILDHYIILRIFVKLFSISFGIIFKYAYIKRLFQ
jgi:hypothetical protein